MEKNNNYYAYLRPVTVAISVASPEPRNLNAPEIYKAPQLQSSVLNW